MKYTVRDFLGEISANYGVEAMEQELHSNLNGYQPVYEAPLELSPGIKRLLPFLDLNDYVRVDKDTYYKVHKGYPSPRSLYPVKLFLSLGDQSFVSKHDLEQKWEFFRNPDLCIPAGDLLLEFDEKYPAYYMHIKKTLLLLETGHFLYNILFLSQKMGIRYSLKDSPNRIHLALEQDEGRTIDNSVLTSFKECYTRRNSGPYLNPITTPYFELLGDVSQFNALLEVDIQGMNDHFGLEGQEIQAIAYYNLGDGRFASTANEKASLISYQTMNKIYPHINFYGVSFFTFFLLEHRRLRTHQTTDYLLALGYLAQSICLKYSRLDQFCRPIKSFNIDHVEKIFSIDNSRYTPFYFLIAGSK